MSRVRYGTTLSHDRQPWVGRLIGALAVAGVGVLIGLQYVTPDKRVLAVMAAAVVFGVAWRLDTISAIGVLLITLPFPRGTVFGNTNLALILLLLMVWLLRFTTRMAPGPRRTPLDAPLVALLTMYVVSFYNVVPAEFAFAFENTVIVVAAVVMYYLIVNNIRTTRDLRRFLTLQCASVAIALLVSTIELARPGTVLIPGWIDFSHVLTEGAELHNLRVGGPFHDYELLAEHCALYFLLFLFLFRQARSIGARTVNALMMGYSLFILAVTQTRGAIVALTTGALFLMFLIRRRLRLVPVTILLLSTAAGLTLLEYVVANFTHSGSVVGRIAETHFKNGLPDTRADVWPAAIERMMHHPLIGWGPYYSTLTGLHFWYWPHDVYLYVANTIGLIGLGCFLWLLGTLWRISRPDTDRLDDPDFVRGYLLIAHVMLLVFLVDEVKIEFLRNTIYLFQPWILFSTIVAAHRLRRAQVESSALTPLARAA